MTRFIAALALTALTACGVDGPPERPPVRNGVTISGEAVVGVQTEL